MQEHKVNKNPLESDKRLRKTQTNQSNEIAFSPKGLTAMKYLISSKNTPPGEKTTSSEDPLLTTLGNIIQLIRSIKNTLDRGVSEGADMFALTDNS